MSCSVMQTGFNLVVSGNGSSVAVAEERLEQADLPWQEETTVQAQLQFTACQTC